jgi:hypothetical protein
MITQIQRQKAKGYHEFSFKNKILEIIEKFIKTLENESALRF